MRHCPECQAVYPALQDLCPDCWEPLVDGAPERDDRLRLVFSTAALYEAEMIEALLRAEGIPCLKVPGNGSAFAPLATIAPSMATRLYVHREALPFARALVEEVTGGSEEPETP